jgi:hypothetical protein
VTKGEVIRVYLDRPMLTEARAGRQNFLNRVAAAVKPFGVTLDFRPANGWERVTAPLRRGWEMRHKAGREGARCLTFRQVYAAPFWDIDAAPERWHGHAARAEFCPGEVDREEARHFAAFWRNRLYHGKTEGATRDGFVFVPFQGKLLKRRSFQSMSPVDMLETLRERFPGKRIVARLHPRESYSGAERKALAAFGERGKGFEMTDAPAEALLATCDLVATENSGLGFWAAFFRKPVILFAESDAHHIAASVMRDGLAGALARLGGPEPDYDAYIYWLWQEMSLNAGRDGVEKKIVAALRRGGMRLDDGQTKGRPREGAPEETA